MPDSLYEFPTVKKYLARVGAVPRSLLKAVVEEQQGDYFTEIAVIRFTKHGEVTADIGYSPSEAEAEAIALEMSSAKWPEVVNIDPSASDLPALIKQAAPEDIFWFRDTRGEFIMAQVRKEQKGKRSYIPVTYYDDGKYRFLEPEGKLPLYGLEQLKDFSTVFIHEGAKAARRARRIAEGKEPEHPWAEELSNAAHLGFIGGALSPHRTDWSVLQKSGVSRVYIVADNDSAGISAIAKIAKELSCITYSIQFTNDWPVAFDLADDFPQKLFKSAGGRRYYVGPSFRSVLQPSTYMTHLVPVIDDKGKPKNIPILRHHARGLFQYIEKVDRFVCVDFPEIKLKAEILDRVLKPFSHSAKTSELLFSCYTGRVPNLAYDPSKTGRVISNNGQTSINLYTPPSIKPQAGDVSPFLEFMEYLVPDAKDRHEVLRWCATLIGRPEVRMLYALLMISETQGVGKSTLSERVLAPLVGHQNVSFPSAATIADSPYNEWLAEKRLVVIGEIYEGHSWKTANKIKPYITDRHLDVDIKYERAYKIDNWAHFVAASNSYGALKIEQSDRRWLIPRVTESKWPEKKFNAFIGWLDSGGLSIIMHWAKHEWSDYVRNGEDAPMTTSKQEMIEGSRSEATRMAADLANALMRLNRPACVGFREVRSWLDGAVTGRIYDSDHEIKKAMKEQGVKFSGSDTRVNVGGKLQQVAMNSLLVEKMVLTPQSGRANLARECRIGIEDFRSIVLEG